MPSNDEARKKRNRLAAQRSRRRKNEREFDMFCALEAAKDKSTFLEQTILAQQRQIQYLEHKVQELEFAAAANLTSNNTRSNLYTHSWPLAQSTFSWAESAERIVPDMINTGNEESDIEREALITDDLVGWFDRKRKACRQTS